MSGDRDPGTTRPIRPRGDWLLLFGRQRGRRVEQTGARTNTSPGRPLLGGAFEHLERDEPQDQHRVPRVDQLELFGSEARP